MFVVLNFTKKKKKRKSQIISFALFIFHLGMETIFLPMIPKFVLLSESPREMVWLLPGRTGGVFFSLSTPVSSHSETTYLLIRANDRDL